MNERICNQKCYDSDNGGNMRKTSLVAAITLVTMAAEIVYGLLTGSMALLADGIHMGTHTFALLVTVAAYYIAARHRDNPNFAFSSGKVGTLGGYTNAIILAITAVYMVYEAVHRLIDPTEIFFNQALFVAVLGLSVNLVSAALLASGGHGHDHGGDHNIRSAYIHVVTDAMTSVLAIIALLTGKYFNLVWLDPIVAIIGAAVILKWAYGLLVSSGSLLVDYHPIAEDDERVRAIAEASDAAVRDFHVWKISEHEKAMIIGVVPGTKFRRETFVEKIRKQCGCRHVTLDTGGDTPLPA